MDPDGGAIDADLQEVPVSREFRKDLFPDALLRPPRESLVYSIPEAEHLGQIAPRHTGSGDIENGFKEVPVISTTPTSVTYFAGEQVRDSLPLLVGEKGPHRPDFSSVTKVHASLEVIGIMGIAVPTVTDEMSLIPYPESMTTDKLTETIIGAAIEVHRELGPGLLESAYEACLAYELAKRGRRVSRQVPLPIKYKGVELAEGYRIDLLVDDLVVVEVKACDGLNPIHQAQLLSYLRLSGRQVGLLLNFHETSLRRGLKRLVYNYSSEPKAS
jgi:GxxExxY protein